MYGNPKFNSILKLSLLILLFFIGLDLQAEDIKEKFKVKPGQIPPPPVLEKAKKIWPGTDTDRYEPNNDLHSSTIPTISQGRYSGTVGGAEDPSDFFMVRVPSSGNGYLVTFEVVGGDAQIFIYSSNKNYLTGYHKKGWIALKPGVNAFLEIRSTTGSRAYYSFDMTVRPVNDDFEPNDQCNQAKFRSDYLFWGHLCNFMDQSDNYVGINDWYSFNLTQPKKLKIEVRNAGLPSTDHVFIYLFEPNECYHHLASTETQWGTSDSATLIVDLPNIYATYSNYPFPTGTWKILVRNYDPSVFYPFGTGEPPRCYSRKYDLIISEIR